MNRFTMDKLELARVTPLLGFTLLLLITIVNPPRSFSQGLALSNNEYDFENSKKSNEQKHSSLKVVGDPFKFPMPLGGLDVERLHSVDQNRDESLQDNNKIPSHSSTILKHSTFKAMIIPGKTPVSNRAENTTNLSFNTNAQNNFTAIHGTGITKDNTTNKIFNLQINGKNLPVMYQLSGSSNVLLNMIMQNNPSLLIHLASRSPGNLTIELARNIIDSKNKDLRSDSPFAVFEDGHEVSYVEKSNNVTRQITIHFNKGISQIAIAGTHVSPEYSATTAFYSVSMCISIFIIIGLARYKRLYSISHTRH